MLAYNKNNVWKLVTILLSTIFSSHSSEQRLGAKRKREVFIAPEGSAGSEQVQDASFKRHKKDGLDEHTVTAVFFPASQAEARSVKSSMEKYKLSDGIVPPSNAALRKEQQLRHTAVKVLLLPYVHADLIPIMLAYQNEFLLVDRIQRWSFAGLEKGFDSCHLTHVQNDGSFELLQSKHNVARKLTIDPTTLAITILKTQKALQLNAVHGRHMLVTEKSQFNRHPTTRIISLADGKPVGKPLTRSPGGNVPAVIDIDHTGRLCIVQATLSNAPSSPEDDFYAFTTTTGTSVPFTVSEHATPERVGSFGYYFPTYTSINTHHHPARAALGDTIIDLETGTSVATLDANHAGQPPRFFHFYNNNSSWKAIANGFMIDSASNEPQDMFPSIPHHHVKFRHPGRHPRIFPRTIRTHAIVPLGSQDGCAILSTALTQRTRAVHLIHSCYPQPIHLTNVPTDSTDGTTIEKMVVSENGKNILVLIDNELTLFKLN